MGLKFLVFRCFINTIFLNKKVNGLTCIPRLVILFTMYGYKVKFLLGFDTGITRSSIKHNMGCLLAFTGSKSHVGNVNT